MTLGLWDVDAADWASSPKLKARQSGNTYSWIKVAAGIIPAPNHHVQFLATLEGTPGVDWYIDEAALLPAGVGISALQT
jgi:hypothetical protein